MDTTSIPAGQFKAKCLKLLDDVNRTQTPLVVTKHGKPVARIVPVDMQRQTKSRFGCLKGSGKITGDIVSPTPEIWNLPQ